MEWKLFCCVRLFVIPWTMAYQATMSMEVSRQEYLNGLPFPSPGESSQPGNRTQISHIAADALTSEPPGKTSFGLYRNEKGCFYLIFNSFTEGRLNTDHSFCLFFLLMFFYLAFPPIIICFIFWLLIHHFSVLLSLLNLIFISYKSFIHLIQPEPFNMYHFHQNSFIICYWFVLPSPFPLPFYC